MLFYTVTKPFRWAARNYVPGEVIELSKRNFARHPTLAGKVVPFGADLKGQTAPQEQQKSSIARQRKTR